MLKKWFLILLFVLVLPALTWAGLCVEQRVDFVTNQVEIWILCTGDAGDGSVDTYVIGNDSTKNTMYLYAIETSPGTGGAQPTAYTLDIKRYDISDGGDSFDYSIVDLAVRSNSAVETVDGNITLDIRPPGSWARYLELGDLGAGDTALIKLHFVK